MGGLSKLWKSVEPYTIFGGYKGWTEGEEHTIEQTPLMTDAQKNAETDLLKFYQKYLPMYEPGKEYSGLSTMMTPTSQETQGLNRLTKYLDQGDNESLGLASGVVNKTLSGGYDPYSSTYYDSMKRQIKEEQGKSLAEAKRSAAKYGYRSSSSENKALADVHTKTSNRLSDLIAQIAENERTRQLSAVPYGLQVASAYDQSALNKIGASQQYGGLSRLMQNVGYQDFLRKQQEYTAPLSVAQGLYNKNVPYGVKSFTYEDPSLLSQLINTAGQLAPYAMML